MLSAMTTVAVVTNDKTTATVAAVVIVAIKAIAAMMANVSAANGTAGAVAAIKPRRLKRARRNRARPKTTIPAFSADMIAVATEPPKRARRVAAMTAHADVAIGTDAAPTVGKTQQ